MQSSTSSKDWSISEWSMSFRAQHGYGSIEQMDVSHDGRRIDHIFASEKPSPGLSVLQFGIGSQ